MLQGTESSLLKLSRTFLYYSSENYIRTTRNVISMKTPCSSRSILSESRGSIPWGRTPFPGDEVNEPTITGDFQGNRKIAPLEEIIECLGRADQIDPRDPKEESIDPRDLLISQIFGSDQI